MTEAEKKDWLSTIPYIIVFSLIALVVYGIDKYVYSHHNSLSGRNFENIDQFKEWVADKTFISIGAEHDQLDVKGNYSKSSGELVLKIHGDKLLIGNCNVDYDCYYDHGNYCIGFKECVGDSDYFTVVVPANGNPYTVSKAYDISSVNSSVGNAEAGAIRTLDAIISRREVRGNEMNVSE